MNLDRVNYVNAGLMVLSCALAWILPFELFLFAYAVLGPLHYLTQISWLHDRKYFASSRLEMGIIWALGIYASLGALASFGEWPRRLAIALPRFSSTEAIFAALGCALVMVTIRKRPLRLALIAAMIPLAMMMGSFSSTALWIGVFLPTIIHVFVFTFIFVTVGALKSPRPSAWISLATFAACTLIILLLPSSIPSPLTAYATTHTPFSVGLASDLEYALGFNPNGALRFVAFAYTYHYLNWFSKTRVIGWGEISRLRLSVILALYAGALTVYAADYDLGLRTLSYLSMTHVLLEFPLNFRSLGMLMSPQKIT